MLPANVVLAVAVPKVKELAPKVTKHPAAPLKSPLVTVPPAVLVSKVAPETETSTALVEGIADTAPIRSVPADTVVVPPYVLAPEKISVPLPCFVTPPDPLI